jgi:hypothetical protein
MNIVKLQDMLRSVPDQALIGYVQQPTGEVPSYLALTELQRRKDMRDKYSQQQAPETSVSEDLQQEATQQDQGGLAMLAGQPQGEGIADLPVDESMYQEQSFAGGGIVAFAGPQGSYVVGEDQDYTDDYRKLREYETQKALRKNYPGMAKLSEPTVRTPYDDALNYYRNLRNQNALAFDQNPEINDAFRTIQKRRDAWMEGQSDPFTKEPPVGSKFNPTGVYSPEDIVKNIDKKLAGQTEEKPVDDKKKPVTDKKLNVKPKDVLPATTEKPVITQPETEEEALRKRMAIYKEFMGGDADKLALKDKLSAMEARAKRQEDLAPWMALTEAGFKTMSGTSPFALTNIGAGAEAGLKSYGAAQDKFATLEEKRYALMNEAAKADRAEQQAAIKFGEDSYQHKQAMDQKDRIANMNADLKREEIGVLRDRVKAISGKGGTSNIKAQADLIVKANKDIDKALADMAGMPLTNPILKAKYDSLLKMKADNEAKIKALFNNTAAPAKGGLANVDLSKYTVTQVDDDTE